MKMNRREVLGSRELEGEPKDRESGEHVGEDRPGEMAGQSIGGIGGAVLGGSFGAVAGPLGIIVGGIAGAVGGWWAGEKVARAASRWGDVDESHFRGHHKLLDSPGADYEDARIGYALGLLAGRNPRYQDIPFVEIESELRRGFDEDHYAEHTYDELRPFIREGFVHARNSASTEDE